MEKTTIGNRIRDLRIQNQLTQDALATMLEVSRVQVNQWESGAREISAPRIVKIAEIFDTSCDYLMRGISPHESLPAQAEDSVSVQPEFHKPTLDISALGLSDDSLAALKDLADMEPGKRTQYYEILNGLLGSKAFWQILMPAASAAFTVKEQSAFGGTESSAAMTLPENLKNQINSSVEVLKLGNAAGYMENLLISKEKAYAFQISEASNAFESILKAIIEKKAHPLDRENELWTAPYQRADSDSDRFAEFRRFFAMFGLTISADNI